MHRKHSLFRSISGIQENLKQRGSVSLCIFFDRTKQLCN